ncbi:uncharacterized protein JN550_007995 [Neoarthrinium moseri]|uniref:uncharacterized protein n=1 Tax=Neoarthrinium moseri TaxID=1658444 RepID=UPI001FDC015A|nr:uncharacterized protein JN550_007995 [Neoarthrinium moseri]KAI1866017.1 hypothetical protein JN550_007995 [Neoarthrinium moseri]
MRATAAPTNQCITDRAVKNGRRLGSTRLDEDPAVHVRGHRSVTEARRAAVAATAAIDTASVAARKADNHRTARDPRPDSPRPGTNPGHSSRNDRISHRGPHFPEPSGTQSSLLDFLALVTPKEPVFYSILNAHNWATADPYIVWRDRKIKARREQEEAKMADPFEVRMRFSNQLKTLNASVVSAQKAAQYALKYRDMSEDLHSCILEQLERNSMNTRANIMYFIEPFLEMAEKEGDRSCTDYIRRMQRDIMRVVDAVCPEDGSGAANTKVVRKVLLGLVTKGFLLEQTSTEIEECLRDRAAASHADVLSSPVNGDTTAPASGTNGRTTTTTTSKSTVDGSKGRLKLEKRQIEQRIEEDRERHKKMRENMWVMPKGPLKVRRGKVWEDLSDAGEDDTREGDEDESEDLDLTGTGDGQEEREREREARTDDRKKHAERNGGGSTARDRDRDPDGDLRMNGHGYERRGHSTR